VLIQESWTYNNKHNIELNYLNFSRIRSTYRDYRSRVAIFVPKIAIDVNCISRSNIIADFNAQIIIIDDKILNNSIALLHIYNEKSKSSKSNNYTIDRILTNF